MDYSKIKEEMELPEQPVVTGVGNEPTTMTAEIYVPLEARLIAEILRGGDPSVRVYVVGGAVRDYLFHKFHTDQTKPYTPKDIDLTTNLSEEEILRRLRSDEAKRFCITVKEKESVDTFGVVFCGVGGKGPYEVAPFRKDIGMADGRRPDKVERGTIREDAMRRDFTINNLYFDFYTNKILDFNEGGRGIEDCKARNVRCVGDPFDRFDEDKLRILRMVRFFSRYNEGLMVEWLDQRTKDAISHFKNLTIYKGMSPERIMTEFLSGLAQCRHPATYLKNYRDLDLFNAVFGHRPVDLEVIERFQTVRNPKVVLAMLLRTYDGDVANILNALKYPNEISEPAQFLRDAMTFTPTNVVDLLKARDKRLTKSNKRELTEEEKAANGIAEAEIEQDITDLITVTDDPHRRLLLRHMVGFNTTVMTGEELMARGYKGPQIGEQQRHQLQTSYNGSLGWFLKTVR